MGLLDDAIREHLELKRLRGADPGLVSREEGEVFGPTRDQEPESGDGETVAQRPSDHEDGPLEEDRPTEPAAFSNVGQETAEIDMSTVLEDALHSDTGPAGPGAAGPGAGAPGKTIAAEPQSDDNPGKQQTEPGEDSLEWEMPGEHAEDDGSGGSDPARGESQDDPVEDVLEETPDFLRDTPEQERLWFEQRPPRDFDFDK